MRSDRDRLEEAQRLAHVGSWEWDAELDVVVWSEELYRIYGLGKKEFTGTFEGFLARVHPEDRAATQDVVARALKQPGPFQYDHRIIRGDGGVRMLRTLGGSVPGPGGGVLRMAGCCMDVTEEWEAERRLEKSRSLLEATLESTADGIFVMDLDGRVVASNARALQLWGLPKELAASGDLDAMVAWVRGQLADPERFEAREKDLMADRTYEGVDEIRFKDGRVFERYSQPQRLGGAAVGRVCSFRDVTECRRAEEALRGLNLELEDRVRRRTADLAESNAELEMFAYAASHDLAAPLRRILSFAELLENRLGRKLEPEEASILESIRRGATGMSKLISDVLELSRVGKDVMKAEKVDLNEVLAEVRADLDPVFTESGARLSSGRLPVLRAHPTLLRRLLGNLVGNALKFRAPGRAPVLKIASRASEGGGADLWVRDNGIGFDPGRAEEIFEPFHRLNAASKYEGNGLGLAICRRIVQRYGGTIRAEGRPGEGSTFTVHFPASALAL